MRSAIVLSFLLVSSWANSIGMTPMKVDTLVYRDGYNAIVDVYNTNDRVTYYDVWITRDYREGIPTVGYEYHHSEVVLGAQSQLTITAPIFDIAPDILEVYYLCAQERPHNKQLGTVGRVCAKFRLYYPQSELLKHR